MTIENSQYDNDLGWLYIVIPDDDKDNLEVSVHNASNQIIKPISKGYQKSTTVEGYGAGGELKLESGYYYTYHGLKGSQLNLTIKNVTSRIVWAKVYKYGLHGDEWTKY